MTAAGAHARPYDLNRLNQQGIPKLLAGIETDEQWQAKLDEIRAVWLDYVGGVPETVPVRYEVVAEAKEKDHVRRTVVYDTVDGDRVTAYLLIPDAAPPASGRYPAILAMHPTGEGGKDISGTAEGGTNRTYGYELVSRGYVVLVPDSLTAGDRIYEGHKAFQSSPFYEQYPQWTTVGKTVVDHMQGVDLLTSLDFVDAEAIGTIGHSFGGYNVFILAGVDRRVKAVVSSCGLYPFTYDPRPGRWGVRDWYTHLPRITPDLERGVVPFEFNEVIALAAPVPMLFYTAQSDRIGPHWQGVGEVLVDLRDLYIRLGHEENLVSYMGVGEHDFPTPIREISYDFLDRWLKGG